MIFFHNFQEIKYLEFLTKNSLKIKVFGYQFFIYFQSHFLMIILHKHTCNFQEYFQFHYHPILYPHKAR